MKTTITNCGILLLLFVSHATALITSTNFILQGPSSQFLTTDYGMVQQGVINVNVQVTPQPVSGSALAALPPGTFRAKYPSYTPATMGGFFLIVLLDSDQKQRWYSNMGTSDASQLMSLCMEPATVRHTLLLDASGRGNFTYTISPANVVSQYSVGLLQCYALKKKDIELSLSVTTEMYNAQPGGLTGRSYLSIENVPQIRILQFELLVMSLLIAILLGQILTSLKPWFALKLHVLFLVVLVLGIALSAVTYAQQNSLNMTGLQSDMFDMAVSVVDHLNTTSELICFLLLSLGCVPA